ncbi:MAG TPA: hypothetical protein VM890_06695 [Longimicrobium sp.]|nr:hypothetical protein [Longimicrobium sp.]
MPHPTDGFRRGVALAALVLLAGACSRDVLDPASPSADGTAPRLAAAAAGKPSLIRNAVKYRDQGAKPATGRSGSSTLTVRALLGMDGATDLEVTTGVFDPVPTATRPLTKVQVKQLDASGHSLRTLNYNGLTNGGTATFRYTGLPRGTTLQVQGHVTEGRRTDVVTATAAVYLRPDLRVRLEAPQQVRAGFPVNLVATVSEGNGDMGARADCVLYVDGVEVDRASGIWVDAGGAVTCAFTYVFPSAGTRRVRVEAANVSPGDFDLTNNAAEATVQVTGGGSDFNYSAQAEDYVETTLQVDSTRSAYDGGQVTAQHTTLRSSRSIQSGTLYGWMPHGVSLATTRVRVSQATNGVTVHAGAWPDAAAGYPLLAEQPGCMSSWLAGVMVYLCSTGTADGGVTNVQYLRTGSQVTYYGVQHNRTWWPDAPDNVYTYTFEWSGDSAEGAPRITMGADYTFAVELTDGGRTYRLDATVPLGAPQTRTWSFYPPTGWKCTTGYHPDFGLRLDICRYHRVDVVKRNGSAFGSAG